MAQVVTEVKKLKFCIDGEWRESTTGKYMPVTDSSTGEVFAETPCCTAAEVEAAIESAQTAFETWSTTPIQKRTQVLYRWKALLEQHAEEVTYLCARELGKNLDEARGEVIKIIEGCEVGVSAPMTMKGESLMNVSTGHDTVSYREPIGVFAGIAPFNFPGMIPFGWMLPLCIVTGNTFVLKLASMVPTTGMRLMELLYRGRPAQGRRQPRDLQPQRGRDHDDPPAGARRQLRRLDQGRSSTSTRWPPPTASASRRRPRPRTTASCWPTPRSSAPPPASSTRPSAAPACAAWRCP